MAYRNEKSRACALDELRAAAQGCLAGRQEYSKMQIHVRLFSRFRDRLPPEAKGEATIELPDGATVAQLLAHLGTETRVKLINVNGEQVTDRQFVLHDGDSVRVFPIAVGG